MSSSTSTLKARHYAALSSSLGRLQQDLGESEIQMVRLADHLGSMQQMGTYSAAQFMAVSRLLDKDLNEAEQGSGVEQTGGNSTHDTTAEQQR